MGRKRGRLVVCAAEPSSVQEFPEVAMFSGGRVAACEAERVARAVGRVVEHRGITGAARVRLSTANGPDGPMLVQVNLQMRDTPVRVQLYPRYDGNLELITPVDDAKVDGAS